MARESSVMGMMLTAAPAAELEPIHAAIGAGLAAGTLRPIVGRELALDEAAQAPELVLRPGAYGKIVLVP
jgi:NADPH2:quinone reductase